MDVSWELDCAHPANPSLLSWYIIIFPTLSPSEERTQGRSEREHGLTERQTSATLWNWGLRRKIAVIYRKVKDIFYTSEFIA